MIEFIRSVYRVFVLIGFWVFLICCTIGGGIIGKMTGGYRSDGHPILGGFIGLIIGFVIDVLVCGFIATILNIDDNLENLNYNLSVSVSDNQPEKKCKKCGKTSKGCSTCPHCGSSDFE